MRGLARPIRSAIAAKMSVRARRRSAAAGISAVSRAMALPVCSTIAARGRFNGGTKIAPMALQQLSGFAAAESEPEQDSGLYISICLFEIARGVAFRTADDFADHDFRAAAQLGVPHPHVDHQSAIDAAHLYHHGGREKVQSDL